MEGPDEYHALVVGTQNLKKKKKKKHSFLDVN